MKHLVRKILLEELQKQQINEGIFDDIKTGTLSYKNIIPNIISNYNEFREKIKNGGHDVKKSYDLLLSHVKGDTHLTDDDKKFISDTLMKVLKSVINISTKTAAYIFVPGALTHLLYLLLKNKPELEPDLEISDNQEPLSL